MHQHQTEPRGKQRSIEALMAEADPYWNDFVNELKPVSGGERVIDTLGNGLQRLYVVYRELGAQAVERGIRILAEIKGLVATHQTICGAGLAKAEECTAFHRQVEELERKLAIEKTALTSAEALFWSRIYVEYPETLQAGEAEIRAGYKLVVKPAETKTPRSQTGMPTEMSDLGGFSIIKVGSFDDILSLMFDENAARA